MNTNKYNPRRMYILQFLTLVSMILVLFISIHWLGFGFGEQLTLFFMIMLFYPNLFGYIHKASHEEITYLIMITLVTTWTFLLYMICHILVYVYENLSIYVYLVCMIPVVILVLYLEHSKGWRMFYKSMTRSPLEDYIKEKARERVEELILELKEIEQDQENEELS